MSANQLLKNIAVGFHLAVVQCLCCCCRRCSRGRHDVYTRYALIVYWVHTTLYLCRMVLYIYAVLQRRRCHQRRTTNSVVGTYTSCIAFRFTFFLFSFGIPKRLDFVFTVIRCCCAIVLLCFGTAAKEMCK